MAAVLGTAAAIGAYGAIAGGAAATYAAKKQAGSATEANKTQTAADSAALQFQKEQEATRQREYDAQQIEAKAQWEATEANRKMEFEASEQQRLHQNALSEASAANQAAQLGLSREEFAERKAQYDADQARRAPYRSAGQTALTSLGDMLGMSFAPGTATPSAARTAAPVAPGGAGTASAATSGPAGGGSPTPEADAMARAQAAAGTAPTENMAPIPGFDAAKMADPTKSNAKYTNSLREFAYTLNAIQPSADPAGLAKAVEYLNTVRGVPAKMVGDDKVDFGDGFGPVDVLIDSGKGGYAFQNNPQPGSAGYANSTLGALLPRVAPKPPVASTMPVAPPVQGPATEAGYTGVIPMRNLMRRPAARV